MTGVLWAAADILVNGEDVTGLALTLQPGLTLSGRVEFDSRDLKPSGDVSGVRPRLVELDGASVVTASTQTRADGTFEIGGIPAGIYRLSAPLNESRWWLRSVMLNGRDLVDFPLEIGAMGDVAGAVATFTDRRTELSGMLQSAGRLPAPEHFVVVFSADRTYWQRASRRVQFTRPSIDGRFAVRDLPAGDYLVGALTDLEPSDLADATFLERLAAAAIRVRLVDGETTIQDLRIAQ